MEYDLVFEGGGAKGMVFVGAMQTFEQRGHTYKRLLGTSAGAITAALLAAGYTAQEMLEALGEQENGRSVFNTFLGKPGPFDKAMVIKSATLKFLHDIDLPFVPDFIENRLDQALVEWMASDPKLACSFSLFEYGGWYSADAFLIWLKKRLDSGEDRGKPRRYSALTLKQFYEETQYDLSMVASDVTGSSMLVLNHRTAPDVPLVWAVRMSMSIPLLWQEVIWQEEWGPYLGKPLAGHAIVDGGILSNFPIELFISKNEHVKRLMGPDSGEAVLGMMIDESLPVVEAPPGTLPPKGAGLFQAPLLLRINNLINTTISARDKMISESCDKMVVRLPAGGYGTTDFDMDDNRRALLVNAGCGTLDAYFNQLEAEALDPGAISFEADMLDEQVHEEAIAQRHADRVALKILQ